MPEIAAPTDAIVRRAAVEPGALRFCVDEVCYGSVVQSPGFELQMAICEDRRSGRALTVSIAERSDIRPAYEQCHVWMTASNELRGAIGG